MRELAGTAVCMLLLIGVAALATETLGDRELMTPPPESVAENFVRSVSLGRYDPARDLTSESFVQRLRELQAQIGRAAEVDAELVERDRERALVRVKTEASSADHLVYVELTWDEEWKVDEVSVQY